MGTITRYAWEGPEETLRKVLFLWFEEEERLAEFRAEFPYDVTSIFPDKPLAEPLAYRIVVRLASDMAKGRYVSRGRFHPVFNVYFFAPSNPNIATLAYSAWSQHGLPDSAMAWRPNGGLQYDAASDMHYVAALVTLHRRFCTPKNSCTPWSCAEAAPSC